MAVSIEQCFSPLMYEYYFCFTQYNAFPHAQYFNILFHYLASWQKAVQVARGV